MKKPPKQSTQLHEITFESWVKEQEKFDPEAEEDNIEMNLSKYMEIMEATQSSDEDDFDPDSKLESTSKQHSMLFLAEQGLDGDFNDLHDEPTSAFSLTLDDEMAFDADTDDLTPTTRVPSDDSEDDDSTSPRFRTL